MPKTLLEHAYSAKHDGWRNFVTPGQNLLYYHTVYESIWLSGDAKTPERERRMIASR
jgi:hypothetical protein